MVVSGVAQVLAKRRLAALSRKSVWNAAAAKQKVEPLDDFGVVVRRSYSCKISCAVVTVLCGAMTGRSQRL